MRIDAFRPAEEFKSHMDNWIERFRNAIPINEEEKVLIPGDPERILEAERTQNGMPLLTAVVEDLKALGDKFGVEFPV
jgi:LDH2 family malate/lactate/ureidoglycolate dehydrogenase